MHAFLQIIKSDYLQRTRSYAFLITLCASLAIAYTFVPEPSASYSTIRIADHIGFYNSSWFGYVTAIMTSIFLSLIGFYLVNGGIKTDIHTKVGQIVSATSISNFKYLFSKVLSNFLVLLTIVGVVFAMSIILFFLYNDGYTFKLWQFVKPYLLITIPALFSVSVLAVVFEVFFGRYSVLQNIGFFILFSFLMGFSAVTEKQFSLDLFGVKIVMYQLEETVREITKASEETSLNIGYVIGNLSETKKFLFNGMDFPISFIISRVLLVLLGIALIALISPLFHRFNIKERLSRKKKSRAVRAKGLSQEIMLPNLPMPKINFSIVPLIKTELLLLFRKGKKWLWVVNIAGMVLLVVLPIKIAHQMVLPILWFLQVGRISDLTCKEAHHNVQNLAFASYKPISRLLVSQFASAIVLMLFLAFPLILRLGLSFELSGVFAIFLGGILIVVLAAFFGIIFKGKKMLEVVFFMLTYANINGIPFLDYFGGFEHNQLYLPQLAIITLIMGSVSVYKRKYELEK